MKSASLSELPLSWTSIHSLRRHGWAIYLAVLLAAVCTRHFVFNDDPNKCQALINTGHWYGDKWLTPACDTNYFSARDIHDCTNGLPRKFVFAGDKQLQGLYWALAHKLEKRVTVPNVRDQKEEDLSFSKGNVTVEYIWDPYLNGTKVVHIAEDLRDGRNSTPLMTVISAAHSFVQNGEVSRYAKTIQGLAEIAYSSGTLPKARIGASNVFNDHNGPGDLLLFAPAHLPSSRHDGPDLNAYHETNRQLEALADRDAAISILWSFLDLAGDWEGEYALDGVNVSGDVSKRRADLLLNLRCNANKGRHGDFHQHGTCCNTWKRNWFQYCFLGLALGILPALLLVDEKFSVLSNTGRPFMRALCAFSATVALLWSTDRTHLFNQVKRLDLVMPNLGSMILITLLICLATVRRGHSATKAPGVNVPNQSFLPRDQTDEWKGWMQALIVIYHYNMAWSDQAAWFWKIIRLTVASYLFLTGFGHTVFFLQKKDFSAKRFVNVMIRTNLLPVTLAYVMRTRWVLYYYMALSTFWYCVLFATMAIKRDWNDQSPLMLAKIGISAAVVHTFLNMKELPETFVKIFRIIFRMSFDAREFFHHRVRQDQYIVYVGMLFAMLYLWVKDVLSSDKRQDRISIAFRKAWPGIQPLIIALSAIIFAYYFYWTTTTLKTASAFSKLQPYLTAIPVVTFTILRNAHPALRNWHSAAFAWLGRYSGEMYVMQDHIFLAVDQEAVLRTGFFQGDDTLWGDRWRDLVLITPLYLIACSIIGDATGVIANWFIEEDEERRGISVKEVAEVEMGLLSGEAAGRDTETVEEKEEVEKVEPHKTIKAYLWPGRVRHRAILVLVVMWILNLTYT